MLYTLSWDRIYREETGSPGEHSIISCCPTIASAQLAIRCLKMLPCPGNLLFLPSPADDGHPWIEPASRGVNYRSTKKAARDGRLGWACSGRMLYAFVRHLHHNPDVITPAMNNVMLPGSGTSATRKPTNSYPLDSGLQE